jgi:membrane protease YdiL (CAAX protease family)
VTSDVLIVAAMALPVTAVLARASIFDRRRRRHGTHGERRQQAANTIVARMPSMYSLAAGYPAAPARVAISPRRLVVLLAAALAVIGVEVVVALGDLLVGAIAAAALIVVLVFERPSADSGGAARQRGRVRSALRVLALVPLARLVTITLPLPDISPAAGILVASAVVLVATVRMAWAVGLRIGGFGRDDIGQPVPLAVGYVLGFIAYLAGAPVLVTQHTAGATAAVAVAALLAAAAAEELLYRGVVQMALQRAIGRVGVVVAVVVFATTYLGSGAAALVLVAFVAGLVFADNVMRTGATGGVVLAHAVMAVTASVVWPVLLGAVPPHVDDVVLVAGLGAASLIALAALLRGRGAGLDIVRAPTARRGGGRVSTPPVAKRTPQ